MRREVESLLAQPPAGLIDAPVGALVAGLVAPSSVLLPGRRIGVFEVQGLLGVGGMGEVYRARDTRLGREVAIKILPRVFKDDPDRLARFEREARVLASLNHPHIGAIYGLEEADGVTALVMELVEGEDLAQRIGRGAVPIVEALPIARQIAEALEAAHDQGIIHRDLKPANIKVRPDGTVKVLDFGLAKALDPAGSDPSLTTSPTLSLATQAGVLLGTAAYMPPEQAKGRPVDRRADLWSFGCVLFEMLTGAGRSRAKRFQTCWRGSSSEIRIGRRSPRRRRHRCGGCCGGVLKRTRGGGSIRRPLRGWRWTTRRPRPRRTGFQRATAAGVRDGR